MQHQIEDALELMGHEIPEMNEVKLDSLEPIIFEREIVLKKVWFRYDEAEPWILNGIDLRIPCGSRIGVIGETGSGKSTLIDLIMGLLSPTLGEIEIDGVALDEFSRRAWRQQIAHVPQSIYLADTSMAENTAFGVPKEKINANRVVEAARKARIEEFVDDTTNGLATRIGERGIRISGGQRQRIGIARALYKEAKVIVLDEATSSLDFDTEERIMRTIGELGAEVTVLMIAHRLTTLKDCNLIVELEAGRVKRSVSYETLENEGIGR